MFLSCCCRVCCCAAGPLAAVAGISSLESTDLRARSRAAHQEQREGPIPCSFWRDVKRLLPSSTPICEPEILTRLPRALPQTARMSHSGGSSTEPGSPSHSVFSKQSPSSMVQRGVMRRRTE